jgi:hypothetical protein
MCQKVTGLLILLASLLLMTGSVQAQNGNLPSPAGGGNPANLPGIGGFGAGTQPGQVGVGTGPGAPGGPFYSPAGPFNYARTGSLLGGGGYAYGFGGSTVYGDAARGYASIVRAYGQASLLNSKAAINYSKARAAEIENRYKYVKSYFELKELNSAYRQQLRGPRATEAQLIRYAQAGAPERLTPQQLDPYTGEISWPAVLRTKPFAKQRQLIEQIFANRVLNNGHIAAEDYIIFDNSLAQMQRLLQERIKQYDTNSYLEAYNFLQSLDYEATS